MNKLPYGGDRKKEHSDRASRVLGYARGGRVDDEKGTKINITIGQPQPGGAGANPGAAGALMGALAQASKPPMPPPAGGPPPMGAGGPGLPGGGPSPMGLGGMKRGGKVPPMTAGAMSGEGRLEKTAMVKRDRRR